MNKPITANSSASFICLKYSRIFFPRPENRQVASPAFLPLTSPPSQTVSESTKCLSSSRPFDSAQDRLREKSLFRAQGEIFLRSLTFVRDDNSVFWTLRHSFSRAREERRSNSTASKTAPQNLYSFRPLNITCELVLVFPRIGQAFG